MEIRKLIAYFYHANGVWGWKQDYCVPKPIKIDNVNVTFIQNGFRALVLHTDEDKAFNDLLTIVLNIVKLLQIGEGLFHSIDHVEGYRNLNDNSPIIRMDVEDLKKEGLIDFYRTHGNFKISKSVLVLPQDIVSSENYYKWKELYGELAVQHHAFLYFSCDNELPIDLRMANLIELCEPLAVYDSKGGLAESKTPLKCCISYLINKYGTVIFSKESNADILDFENKSKGGNSSLHQRLVNTRVNILHYKLKPRQSFYSRTPKDNNPEIVIYCNKMHLLYCTTILGLLDISIDEDIMKGAVQYIESEMFEEYDFDGFINGY